mmetsp:Transcript_27460/g.64014  ORF Transcript_27460/g.64014 Transcript_27460/m.64014 type:complete len:123 (-) Transcript_27460:890-1258(-)
MGIYMATIVATAMAPTMSTSVATSMAASKLPTVAASMFPTVAVSVIPAMAIMAVPVIMAVAMLLKSLFIYICVNKVRHVVSSEICELCHLDTPLYSRKDLCESIYGSQALFCGNGLLGGHQI